MQPASEDADNPTAMNYSSVINTELVDAISNKDTTEGASTLNSQ